MKPELWSQVRDSFNHEIPRGELLQRDEEVEELRSLLREHSKVIVTADNSYSGKSTFARIVRSRIQKGELPEFSDCILQRADSISAEYGNSRRQNKI